MLNTGNRWWWLVLGIFIGWVAEWLVELFYWRWKRRSDTGRLERQLSHCWNQVATLETKLSQARVAAGLHIPEVVPEEVSAAMGPLVVGRGTAPLAAPAAPAGVGIPAQDLAVIRGIGPVFEQMLNNAGIGTYSQLAALGEAELSAIIQPEDWQEFNQQTWSEQARAWAAKTGTEGAVWNGIIPDDLTEIAGIGEVFERKLYEAGILTFAELAGQTIARLDEIIQPKNWQRYDFASWIAQARDRSQGADT
jgi:predicted flap endonuclease-1-like 5' DNA nuclease